jgi:hypothetical protein
MQIRITYKGTIDGVYGIYCGFKPENLVVEEEIPVYYPDEGKIFVKDGEKYSAVVLQDGESIEDYEEIEYDDNDTDRLENQ